MDILERNDRLGFTDFFLRAAEENGIASLLNDARIDAFFPRSKHLLISWLQSPSAVILEPKKMKSVTFSIVSPSI